MVRILHAARMELLSLLCFLLFTEASLARSSQHVDKRLEGYRDVRERVQEHNRDAFRSAKHHKPEASLQYLNEKT